jgi:hypothetical protein
MQPPRPAGSARAGPRPTCPRRGCRSRSRGRARRGRSRARRSASSRCRSYLAHVRPKAHTGREQARTDEAPAVLLDVVEVARVPGERVAVAGGVDAAAAELLRLGVGQVPAVALVEHAVGEGRARADGEEVAVEARAVRVDVVHLGALWEVSRRSGSAGEKDAPSCPSRRSSYPRVGRSEMEREARLARTMLRPMPLYEYTRFERYLLAAATEIRSRFRSSCRRHWMPRYVSQYWQSATRGVRRAGKRRESKHTGTAGHRPEQVWIDLDDLLDRAARCAPSAQATASIQVVSYQCKSRRSLASRQRR